MNRDSKGRFCKANKLTDYQKKIKEAVLLLLSCSKTGYELIPLDAKAKTTAQKVPIVFIDLPTLGMLVPFSFTKTDLSINNHFLNMGICLVPISSSFI